MFLLATHDLCIVEFLILLPKIKICLFILMDSRSLKVKHYPMTLLLPTHDLRLWLLRDATHEQQFLGCRVSYFFAKIKNCLFVLIDSRSFKIKHYPIMLLLATHDLRLLLLHDAVYEQQFLGCRV